jgi:alkaline phosphatase D
LGTLGVVLLTLSSLGRAASAQKKAAPSPEAPPPRAEAPVRRIAFGSCLGQDGVQPIWKHVLASKPDAFVFLGDNVYADTDDPVELRAAYAKLGAQPGYQALKKATRVLATWDDHDYGRNDAGAEYPMKEESKQIFLDFFGVPKDSPRRRRDGVYHAEVFGPPGQRVQVILLDTRFNRSPLVWQDDPQDPVDGGRYRGNTDPGATVLGEAQWTWLEDQLRLPAQVRIIGSSIQVVDEDYGGEKWANFPAERKRLFTLLWRSTGSVFISGDRHFAELAVMDSEAGYPTYDLTSSSLNWSERIFRLPERNRHRVALLNRGDNFGLVEIDWDRRDPLLRFKIVDEDGEVMIHHKVELSVLRESNLPFWNKVPRYPDDEKR